jgi:DNA-binding winged helix-turn-helix (wHTH) protein
MTDAPTMFVFGPFSMDPARRSLSREGQPVPLTPKEYDTLWVLVAAGGKVVDKETLMSEVWRDSYVGDGSLARNISVLRKALGEEVIETLSRRGYRITLPVALVPVDVGPSVLQAAQAEEVVSSRSENSFAVLEPAPPPRRRWLVGSAVAAGLLIVFAASRFFAINAAKANHSPAAASASSVRSILIQKEGALDPVDEGFQLFRADGHYKHVLYNPETNGWDRWRLVTDDQNNYHRPLSAAEKEFALQKDWKLTCVCALERGAGASDIDFGQQAPRFDIGYLQEGSKYFVVLTRQISPTFEWDQKIEFPGVADVDHPHTYELRYDHLSRTASLWIDGQMKASGYRGHTQFRENTGVILSAAKYLDAKTSSMVFRTVRFEAQ